MTIWSYGNDQMKSERVSGDSARMRRFAWTFAGRLRDKYHNRMSWLK